MVVPVIKPPFVVGDDDVLGAEVVGDGDDPVNQGQHEVISRLGAVHPEDDSIPWPGDEGEAEGVRLKQNFILQLPLTLT